MTRLRLPSTDFLTRPVTVIVFLADFTDREVSDCGSFSVGDVALPDRAR